MPAAFWTWRGARRTAVAPLPLPAASCVVQALASTEEHLVCGGRRRPSRRATGSLPGRGEAHLADGLLTTEPRQCRGASSRRPPPGRSRPLSVQLSAPAEKVQLALPHVLAEGAGWGGEGRGARPAPRAAHFCSWSTSPAPHQAADPSPTLTILSEMGGGL